MEALPPDLARFAATFVPSTEELQVLVLFVEGRDRWYDANRIAKLLSIPLSGARAALDHLARHNLLDIRVTGDVRYRFRPGTHELETQATALVNTYRRNPQQVLRLIT
jgi:DNA-binding IclR family transcriptional regulator